MRVLLISLLTALLAACQGVGIKESGTGSSSTAQNNLNDSLPAHPSELEFGERVLKFPDQADYRHQLADGSVAFIVEDHSLPLVRITLRSRAGSYLLPKDQAGLATLSSSMLRDGGTRDLSAEEVDERLDFLASTISFNIGGTSSSAGLDSLSTNLDETIDLMFDMLTEPRFDDERLTINRDRIVEAMRRRNDDTRGIEPRVWSDLLLGESFFVNHRSTQDSVNAVDADSMKAFVDRVFASGDLVVSVSGDVDTNVVIELLNSQIARLQQGESLPKIPETPTASAAGLYGVNKDDVNQTRVSIGHPGPRVGDPDEYALAVMNDILGGGGFTSRITSRVRSDEGLAYSAGSSFQLGRYYPGQFRAFFQSKNESVAQAIAIVMEEIERIRSEAVSDKELSTAKESQLSFLADLFSSAGRTANRFATDELVGRDHKYWSEYEQNIRNVSQEDVQRVATEHLQPSQLRILLVGKLDDALAGDGEFGEVESNLGLTVNRVKLKDPLTLEPLE